MDKKITLVILFIVAISAISQAASWSAVVSLKGAWSFSVGDDMEWAKPEFNDSDWDEVYVPSAWEKYYPEYNGYGWYRNTFDLNKIPGQTKTLELFLGYIDDVDEVFINGQKVGQSGRFFPDFTSAYDELRRYTVPIEILNSHNNVIAVRVFDDHGGGGIESGSKIGLYYDNDLGLLSQNLSGKWKFSIFRERNYYSENFDDTTWDEIMVPGHWEDQGYAGHDGYGWYRNEFQLNSELVERTDLYLVLGQIDDMDRVYFNGKLIGRTEDLDNFNKYTDQYAYRFHRIYFIPSSVLKKENVIAIEVKDYMYDGGIYEGPIGIMTRKDVSIYIDNHREETPRSPWEEIRRLIFD